ncbi:hypothetical protein VTJ49DRAFT_5004 [Mycothermus thermophilus]|uniref:Secreted protein n=1 Tax=Humicola insolens TaxID=85995 RepID=A0ABR3VKW2_HUMIN
MFSARGGFCSIFLFFRTSLRYTTWKTKDCMHLALALHPGIFLSDMASALSFFFATRSPFFSLLRHPRRHFGSSCRCGAWTHMSSGPHNLPIFDTDHVNSLSFHHKRNHTKKGKCGTDGFFLVEQGHRVSVKPDMGGLPPLRSGGFETGSLG